MKEKIQKLINQSRKERDYAKLSTYQTILSSIQEREARENVDLTDEQILSVIEKEKKLFEESAEAFAVKNKEQSRIYTIKAELCDDFLPDKLDENQYGDIVDQAIQDVKASSMKDMGGVIKTIKEKYGKSVDMGKMSAMVKEILIKL